MVKGYPPNSVICVTIVTQELRRGSGVHPRNVHVDIHMLCLQNTSIYKTMTIRPDTHTNSYILQRESAVIHSKILPRKVNQF